MGHHRKESASNIHEVKLTPVTHVENWLKELYKVVPPRLRVGFEGFRVYFFFRPKGTDEKADSGRIWFLGYPILTHPQITSTRVKKQIVQPIETKHYD